MRITPIRVVIANLSPAQALTINFRLTTILRIICPTGILEINTLVCKNKRDAILDKDAKAIEDETSKYHEMAMYWQENYDTFDEITKKNSAAYIGTAVPAYAFSLSTLVAFGLILKHAEKAKEKEDEEAVLNGGK